LIAVADALFSRSWLDRLAANGVNRCAAVYKQSRFAETGRGAARVFGYYVHMHLSITP
jgi:hypothetical protein